MKLKLYLLDRLPLIASYVVSISLFGLVLQLEGLLQKQPISWDTWLYGLSLAITIFLGFLIYDYRKRVIFLRGVEQYVEKGQTLHNSLFVSASYTYEQEMVAEAFSLLRQQYLNEAHSQQAKGEQQHIFMNQWIHQMKTPVSIIELILQQLEQTHRDAKPTIESIREENTRILNGLDLALNIARIDQFEKDYKVEEVDLIHLMRDSINQHRKEFIQSRIFPKFVHEEEKYVVTTDQKWLSIAVNQMVMNALKYTRMVDREKKEVHFHLEETEQTIMLHIIDNGIGISKQDVKRIFEPFFTGMNGRKIREATGMGLYITKQICDRLNHRLTVESTEREGAVFTIHFHKGESYHQLMRKVTGL
jgi:signal transduction histidine kinase